MLSQVSKFGSVYLPLPLSKYIELLLVSKQEQGEAIEI